MDTTIVLRVGDRAPDFTLKDNRNRDVRLKDLRGRSVLLSWHPLAWTNVCAEQMKELEAAGERLKSLGTAALGLSVDPVPTKNAWAKHLGIEHTPLLSDFWPHGGAASDYGIFLEDKGFSARANLIVDPEGFVAYIKLFAISQLPDLEDVFTFLGRS